MRDYSADELRARRELLQSRVDMARSGRGRRLKGNVVRDVLSVRLEPKDIADIRALSSVPPAQVLESVADILRAIDAGASTEEIGLMVHAKIAIRGSKSNVA